LLATVSALLASNTKLNVADAELLMSVSLTSTDHFAILAVPLPVALELYLAYVPPIKAINANIINATIVHFFAVLFLNFF